MQRWNLNHSTVREIGWPKWRMNAFMQLLKSLLHPNPLCRCSMDLTLLEDRVFLSQVEEEEKDPPVMDVGQVLPWRDINYLPSTPP